MSSTDPVIQPPSILTTIVTNIGSHLFTLAAGALAANGVIQDSQRAQFISIGSSVLVWLAGYAWSEYQSYSHRKTAAAMVAQAKAS